MVFADEEFVEDHKVFKWRKLTKVSSGIKKSATNLDYYCFLQLLFFVMFYYKKKFNYIKK